MDLKGRKWLFKSLVGSHNYNLDTEESDRDYKMFFLPTFDDLYNGEDFYQKYLSEEEDIEAHDIRKVIHLWCKANVNFIEVLFSEEVKINPKLDNKTSNLLMQIVEMKNKIAKMNLPYLFDACRGMHFQKMSKLEEGTSGTQYLVDEYGYDTKQALHAYRILDFLEKFHSNRFVSFKQAIWYEDSHLLEIKHGKYSLEEYQELVNNKLEEVQELEEVYKGFDIDEATNDKLQSIVKEMVKEHIMC